MGLPPNRADIIPFGVAIYEAVMKQFDFTVQFVWKPTPNDEEHRPLLPLEAKAAAEQAKAAGGATPAPPPSTPPNRNPTPGTTPAGAPPA